MANYTKSDIINIVENEGVRFIRLQFTDILGIPKNVALTISQLEKALNNQIMFDGSSIEGFVRIEESDMYLYPDFSTFCILPWKSDGAKEARLICDVYTPDGTPFSGDPRNVLKRALAHANELGYSLNIGPECEFFLFNTDEKGNPTTITNDSAGYFDLGPIDNGENCRRDITIALEEMGFEVEASHHECGRGQHEVDFKYDNALDAADKIMTFKLVVKTIARQHGLHATFMPKPIFGIAGSGMHINMSLSKNDKNAFCDENDEIGLSETAYGYIAGLMDHIIPMTSITNPLVNSYKRLVPGYEAPCYVAWSAQNRSPLIRIPASRGAGTRVELRNPDPSANPYLTIAACLMAGLDGIKRGLKPPTPVNKNIFDLTEEERNKENVTSLPRDLFEAITYTKNDDFMKSVLGSHIHEAYVLAKEKEFKDAMVTVSPWEIENYLTIY